MTGENGPPLTDLELKTEAFEELLTRLRAAGAPERKIGDVAMEAMLHLLDIEHPHLAAWHACRYEAFWDDGRKLDIVERLHAAGMESYAILFCHRWKRSETCKEEKPRLYRDLFPPLPPRNDTKERP